jgi:carbon monoxide dehydrogenase subunit G
VRFRHELHTHRPADEVLAYVSDFGRISEWDPSVIESRDTTPGPLGVGSEFEVVVRFLGRRVRFRYRMTAYEPARRAVLVGEARRVRSVDAITCEPAAGGTRVTYEVELELRGAGRLLAPLVRPLSDAMARRALASLQVRLDASGTI